MAMVDGSTCLRDAALELALPYPTGTNPYTTPEVQIQQLLSLANAMGQELAREYAWTALQKLLTVSVVAGTVLYALPADWNGLLPGTAYANGTAWPLVGSLAPSQWANLTAWGGSVGGGYFRIQGDKLEVSPGTPTQVLKLAYRSLWWAGTASGVLSSEEMSATAPAHVYDRRLMVNAVKNAFNEARGFDSTSSSGWLERALSRAKGSDGTPPVLELGRSPGTGLGGVNLPYTNWGK